MNETSLTALFILLVGLIILSAFFSSSETGMMSLNRYRLKHMANTGHKGAQRAQGLLNRTDQLIGVILIGNNFVNILARSDFITNIVLTLCVPQLSELDSNGAKSFLKRGNGDGD
mgnify:CR=1 FL=1